MKGLVAANEKRRRPLPVEYWAQTLHSLLRPIFRRSPARDTKIKLFGWHKQAIRVLETARLDSIDPDHEAGAALEKRGGGLDR